MKPRSRLQKRLQRHGRIALLARSALQHDADGDAAPEVRPSPGWSGVPSIQRPGDSAPALKTPAPGNLTVQPGPLEAAASHSEAGAQPQHQPAARPAAPGKPAPPVVPASAPNVDPPAPEETQNEQSWSRLRAIFNRHQKENTENPKSGREPVERSPDIRVVPRPDDSGRARRKTEAAPRGQGQIRPDRPAGAKQSPAGPPAPDAAPPHPPAGPAENGDETRQDETKASRTQTRSQGLKKKRPDTGNPPRGNRVQRMFPGTHMMGPHFGFPDPYVPHIPGPVPLPLPPGTSPLPFPYPGGGHGGMGGGIGGGFGGGPGGGGGGGGTPGGGLSSTGSVSVGGSAEVGGDASAGGSMDVGGSLTAGGSVSAGAGVSAGGNIEAGSSVQSGTEISPGGNVEAGSTVQSGSDLSPGGSLTGSEVSVTGQATAGSELKSEGDMTLGGEAAAGGGISAGGDLTAASTLDAGSNVSTGANLGTEGDVNAGSVMMTSGDTEVQGNAQSGAAMLGMGDVSVQGSAEIGSLLASGGDMDLQGPGTIGGAVAAAGDLTFNAAASVGGAVIGKGKTEIAGTLSTSVFKGQEIEVGGSINVASMKARDLSAGGSVTIGGRADVGTINAGSVTVHGSAKIGSGGPTAAPKADEDTAARKTTEGAADPVPLQDAWPVQRKEDQPDHPSPTAVETDSSVEVIPPSRPRPVLQKKPVEPSGTRVPREPAAENDRHGEVQTEIGALPADLWDLLGRKAPQQERVPAAAGQPPGIENRTPKIFESPGAGEKMDDPRLPDRLPAAPADPPTAVQRQVAEQPEEDSAAGGDEEEMDVDKLAKKVYAQLRRRLQVEAERKGLKHAK